MYSACRRCSVLQSLLLLSPRVLWYCKGGKGNAERTTKEGVGQNRPNRRTTARQGQRGGRGKRATRRAQTAGEGLCLTPCHTSSPQQPPPRDGIYQGFKGRPFPGEVVQTPDAVCARCVRACVRGARPARALPPRAGTGHGAVGGHVRLSGGWVGVRWPTDPWLGCEKLRDGPYIPPSLLNVAR